MLDSGLRQRWLKRLFAQTLRFVFCEADPDECEAVWIKRARRSKNFCVYRSSDEPAQPRTPENLSTLFIVSWIGHVPARQCRYCAMVVSGCKSYQAGIRLESLPLANIGSEVAVFGCFQATRRR